MNRAKVQQCLVRKLQVVEAIIAKTETQMRFVGKRQMKGLWRVLRERQELIDELGQISQTLEQAAGRWQTERDFQPLLKSIKEKSSLMIRLSEQAVEAVKAERCVMAGELRQLRMAKSVNKTYLRPWQGLAVGRNFSAKG